MAMLMVKMLVTDLSPRMSTIVELEGCAYTCMQCHVHIIYIYRAHVVTSLSFWTQKIVGTGNPLAVQVRLNDPLTGTLPDKGDVTKTAPTAEVVTNKYK